MAMVGSRTPTGADSSSVRTGRRERIDVGRPAGRTAFPKRNDPAPMYYHSFLVSRELGGAGLIALKVAKWMSRQGASTQVWVPCKGAAASATQDEGLPWKSYNLDAMKKGNMAHAPACM